MKRRNRKKLTRIMPPPKAAQWDFWKTRQGKFAARFSIGFDGYVLPAIENLPARFNHIVFGLPRTIKEHRTNIDSTNGLVTDADFYWHRIAVRFSARLDSRETLDELFNYLHTVARIEGGKITLPTLPEHFTERRSERAGIRKRLRRGRSYASF